MRSHKLKITVPWALYAFVEHQAERSAQSVTQYLLAAPRAAFVRETPKEREARLAWKAVAARDEEHARQLDNIETYLDAPEDVDQAPLDKTIDP